MEVRRGYRQTEAGVIPEDWEERSLFDLADRRKELFDDGDWIEAEYLTDGGIRLVQTGNIGEGHFTDKESKKYISAESFTKLGCKALQVGDILICRLAEPAGRACILPDIGEERMITAVDVTIFRPPSSTADRRYLVDAFNTRRWFQSVNERCGGTTRTRIARGELGKISIPLPPLHEQHAIATALSDVDALLGGLDRLIAKKRDLKQAAMQQLLTGQTRLPGFHGEWEVKRIGEFTTCVAGGTPRTFVPSYWGGSIKWMSSGELHLKQVEDVAARITEDGLRNSAATILPKKCVLVGLAGQGKTRGTVAINMAELSTNQSIAAVLPSPAFVPEYLYYNLDRRYDELRDLSSGGGGRGGLNLKLIGSIPIALPSIAEQTAIAAVLSDMDAELSALEARRDKTRDFKQAMMQELLTGKTRLAPGGAADA